MIGSYSNLGVTEHCGRLGTLVGKPGGVRDAREINEEKLNGRIGGILQDLGGAFSVPLVQIGEALGLYAALAEGGPMTSQQFAGKTGLTERYLREWLSAQAASNYVSYGAESDTFSMTPEQAFVFANRSSPFYLAPAFAIATSLADNLPAVKEAFKSGEGVPWGAESPCLSCMTAEFFRPGYENNVMQAWLPALEGVVEKLEEGAEIADIGCGHGLSTMIMAQGFAKSRAHGFDFHAGSIEEARHHAAKHGVENVDYHVQEAKELPGEYDLVTFFDCLHDMGDPIGAMRRAKKALKPGGMVMIVEPMAADSLAENLNPVGRMYYAASTMVCVPTSLAQETGLALGAQAGEKRLRSVAEEAGFTSFRRATETPFNLILEARA